MSDPAEPKPAESRTVKPEPGQNPAEAPTASEVAAKTAKQTLAATVMADLALRVGRAAVDAAVDRAVLGGSTVGRAGKRMGKRAGVLGAKATSMGIDRIGAAKLGAGRVVKGNGLGQSVAATVLVNVARRSVPGAIVVGGALLAKTLYDRRREKARAATANAEPAAAKPARAAKPKDAPKPARKPRKPKADA